MKKILLALTALLLVAIGIAQELKPVSSNVKDICVTRKYGVPYDLMPPMVNRVPASSPEYKNTEGDVETELFHTIYDLQTYASLSNRICAWDDYAMAAVGAIGNDNPTGFGFPDRGTGYGFYDGSSWNMQQTGRIESVRTCCPNIAPWSNNGEVVVSYEDEFHKLMVLTRENKGTGPWTERVLEGPFVGPGIGWPRMTASGENNEYIHVFSLTRPTAFGGAPWLDQDGALLYYRSTDGGETWDIAHQQLPGIGADNYLKIGPDDYTLASKGNMLVLLIASPWYDLAMWKSLDNGETWEKTVIWEHPYPFFDLQTSYTTDTLWCVDGSADVCIDDNGRTHVVWGISRVARLSYNPPDPGYFTYWPYTDGVGYWNEYMNGPVPVAENPHHTMMDTYLDGLDMLMGWTPDLNGSGERLDFEGTGDPQFHTYRELGISGMPSIAFDEECGALVWSSVTETFTTADGAMNYKHIWHRDVFIYNNDIWWSDMSDLVGYNIFHLYDECIYPVVSDKIPDFSECHIIYQADNYPGLFLEGDHGPVTNRIIHLKSGYPYPGIHENQNLANENVHVANWYPNPASGYVSIDLQLFRPENVRVEIFNLHGQKVKEFAPEYLSEGNHTFNLDISRLSAGAYFLSIAAGTESVSRKLIVE